MSRLFVASVLMLRLLVLVYSVASLEVAIDPSCSPDQSDDHELLQSGFQRSPAKKMTVKDGARERLEEREMDHEEVHDGDSKASFEDIKVVSFNVGMSRITPFYKQRWKEIVQVVPKIDADVMCFQEIFIDEYMEDMKHRLLETFPYLYQVSRKNATTARCGLWELLRIATCLMTKEFDQCQTSLTQNGVASRECSECLYSQWLDTGSFPTSFLYCAAGAGIVPWGGNNGLLLASKLPLTDAQSTPLDGFFVNRDILHAKIGKALVGCTHFATETSMPYTGRLASYEAENQQNFEDTLRMFKTYDGPAFFMGDLNSGPSIREQNIDAFYGPSFAKVKEAGMNSSVEAMSPVFCTWCYDAPASANPLTQSWPHNVLLDHVIFQNMRASGVTRILLQRNISVYTGQKVSFSDHYALKIVLSLQ